MQCLMCPHSCRPEALCAAAGVVVYNFVAGGVHIAQTSPLHLHSLPVTFGLSAFVYSGHAVFPSIYRSMKDRSQYPRMLDTTYAIVGVTGALMGEPTGCTAHQTENTLAMLPTLCKVAAQVAGQNSFPYLLFCQKVTYVRGPSAICTGILCSQLILLASCTASVGASLASTALL